MTFPFLPDSELEARALVTLAAYERTDGPVLIPPVPIQFIVENTCDLQIDWIDGPPFNLIPPDRRVPAAISVTPSRRKLLMNVRLRPFFDRYPGTLEFSMAHEAGHAVLHLSTSLDQQTRLFSAADGVLLCRSDRKDRQEIQAERFAAYLLMPEHLVHAAVGTHPIASRADIDDLRTHFRVSWTAMRLRLEELDLAVVDRTGRVHPNRAAVTGQRTFL